MESKDGRVICFVIPLVWSFLSLIQVRRPAVQLRQDKLGEFDIHGSYFSVSDPVLFLIFSSAHRNLEIMYLLSARRCWKTRRSAPHNSRSTSRTPRTRCTRRAWTRFVVLVDSNNMLTDHNQTITVFCHFLLAMVLHPEVFAKAQKEIDSVVGNDRLPTFSDRASLPYGT